jgi:hypothetical protein
MVDLKSFQKWAKKPKKVKPNAPKPSFLLDPKANCGLHNLVKIRNCG